MSMNWKLWSELDLKKEQLALVYYEQDNPFDGEPHPRLELARIHPNCSTVGGKFLFDFKQPPLLFAAVTWSTEIEIRQAKETK